MGTVQLTGRTTRRALLGAGCTIGAVALADLLTGCTASAESSPPSGVDQLTIPTPSPDPTDFVAGVDNPWFPLPVGGRWTYGVEGERAGVVTRTASVGPNLAGVPTTSLRTLERGAASSDLDVVDLYSQDRSGNVWWFGHRIVRSSDANDVSWEAGAGLAEGGLVMAATPRLGDGYRAALVPHQVDAQLTVASTDASADAGELHLDHLLAIDVLDALHDVSTRCYFQQGVGLVATQPLFGTPNQVWFLRDDAPPAGR